ncbi:MAG TPA: SPOR domain-containing protein [Sphingomicrobium sp.]|jgi:Flp pilus assembly protein TadD
MRGLLHIRSIGALALCAGGLAAVVAVPAAAASYSPYDETAAAALARYVRALTHDSRDFQSLVGAGRAALELGDTQAAAGFFARADEVNPRSPLPHVGMGAVSVANGNAVGAMPYFGRAQQLGATQAMFGCARGLAFDMLGQQAQAQADYRAGLKGADADECRRRLALSLAISGDKAGALDAIAPLATKGDASSARVRAFVLALSGDTQAAMRAIDSAMPGSWSQVAPFLQRLPALAAGQKAAAVNLGIFPDAGSAAFASAPSLPSTMAVSESVTSDRLAGIDALLRAPAPQRAEVQPQYQPQPQQAQVQPQYQAHAAPMQVSYSLPARPVSTSASAGTTYPSPKIWLQLASGGDPTALSRRFAQLKSRNGEVLEGIPGYLAQGADGARLVIGPFRGPSDARILAEDLRSLGVSASNWTNSASDRFVPLATQ